MRVEKYEKENESMAMLCEAQIERDVNLGV